MTKLITALAKDFKGEGQKLADFYAEVKKLTPKDRKDFQEMYLKEQGLEVEA